MKSKVLIVALGVLTFFLDIYIIIVVRLDSSSTAGIAIIFVYVVLIFILMPAVLIVDAAIRTMKKRR